MIAQEELAARSDFETYHVFEKVKSMLKKKRCILRKMHLKYEE